MEEVKNQMKIPDIGQNPENFRPQSDRYFSVENESGNM